MGRTEEEDSGTAEGSFDWVGDVYGEGLEGKQVRENDDSTSAECAGQDHCSVETVAAATAAAATAVAGSAETGGGAAEEDMAPDDPARERHKAAERERRKSMRELFLSLHALLPHEHSVRKEQSAILDEVIGYIPLAASRLRTLRSKYSHHHATRVLRSPGASPTRGGSTSTGSWRSNGQRFRQHPYSSSACSSSGSSTTYARSSCNLVYSNGQSPLPPALPDRPGRHLIVDDRRVRATDAVGNSNISSGCLYAPVPNHQLPPLQLDIQLQQQQDETPNSSSTVSSPTFGHSPSVSVRVRGDRVSISVIDTREPYTSSSSCSSHGLLMLSAVLDELDAHHLRLIRSTHCRDGTKLLHYSESKIPEEMEGTPTQLKAKLQHLAHKLKRMRNASMPSFPDA